MPHIREPLTAPHFCSLRLLQIRQHLTVDQLKPHCSRILVHHIPLGRPKPKALAANSNASMRTLALGKVVPSPVNRNMIAGKAQVQAHAEIVPSLSYPDYVSPLLSIRVLPARAPGVGVVVLIPVVLRRGIDLQPASVAQVAQGL